MGNQNQTIASRISEIFFLLTGKKKEISNEESENLSRNLSAAGVSMREYSDMLEDNLGIIRSLIAQTPEFQNHPPSHFINKMEEMELDHQKYSQFFRHHAILIFELIPYKHDGSRWGPLLCENARPDDVMEYFTDTVAFRKILHRIVSENLVTPEKFDEKIWLGSLNIAERCMMQCPYCFVGAKPTDSLMEWDMFAMLMNHPDIRFDFEEINLCDGEVTLWQDQKAGKDLSDIARLMTDADNKIQFTTAGFDPAITSTTAAIRKMAGIQGLRIDISFNLLGRERGEKYERKMAHTIRTINESGIPFRIVLMARDFGADLERTMDVLGAILQGFLNRSEADNILDNAERRTPIPIIPAYAYKHSKVKGPIFEFVADGIEHDRTCEHVRLSRTIHEGGGNGCGILQPLNIRPNGDVTPHCLNGPKRYSCLGNVFENDALQINRAYREFVAINMKRLSKGDLRDMCCFHRYNPIRIDLEKSQTPLLKRKTLFATNR